MSVSTLPADIETAIVPAPRLKPTTVVARRSLDIEGLVRRTNDLLAAGVPLTLLMDLTDPAGPHSQALFTDEVGDLSWLRG